MRYRVPAGLATLLFVGLAGCATGVGSDDSVVPGAGPSGGAGPLLYVANQTAAAVTVIDRSAMSVAEVVDLEALGYGANANPHHVAVEPDGSAWYVSLIGANAVLKFDRDNELVGSAEFEVPGLLALHPTEDWLFVGRSMAAVNPPSRIGRIDRTTMEVEEFEVFIPRPHGITVTPDGETVFVASLAENTLAVVDAELGSADLRRVTDAPTHMMMVQLVVSPNGETLVATGQMSASLFVFSLDAGDVPTLTRSIPVGAEPWHPAFTPDGTEVWFGNFATDELTVVDARDWSIAVVIRGEGISEPHGSAVSPDGSRVYVANRNTDGRYRGAADVATDGPPGTVVVLDAATREILEVIETPPYAAGMGLAAGAR